MRKYKRIVAILAACLLLFSGCVSSDGKDESSESSTSSQSSEASQITSSSQQEDSQASESSESSVESSESNADSSEPSEPTSGPVETSFYDDAVFIGDSVSLRLDMYCQAHQGALGKAQFLTAGSLGSGNALEKVTSDSVHPYYQGEHMSVEDGVKASGAKKVFIMLGMNDVGLYGVEDSVKNMETLTERILEKNPDAEIYLQSMTPMLTGHERKVLNNENLDKYNAGLKELAKEKGYHFADVASVMKQEDGSLKPEYCSDPEGMGIHFTDAGAEAWIDYLLQNANSF